MAEYHKDQLPEDGIHVAIRWRVMDQAARDALALTDADVGGLLVQDDVMSLFVLLSAAPVTWSQVPDGDSTLAAILAVNAEVLERVEGPATANDNAIALFDGSTGKLIKESVASIDNLGNITTGGMVDGVDISNLAMALALVAVPDYVTLSSTPTLGNERTLTAGAGITITDDGPGGAVTVTSTGGAPVGASYVTLGANATLTSERVLTAGANITITDGGAGGPVTIAGTGGGGGAPTTAQYLTLATDATLTSERVLTAGIGIAFVDAGAGGALTINNAYPFNIQPGAAYTLTLADANAQVDMSGANVTVTIPNSSTVAFATGTKVRIVQGGTGILTIAGAGGVTLFPPAGYTTQSIGQGGVIDITLLGSNTWLLNGDLQQPFLLNNQTGTAYTLVLADAPKCVTMNNAAANTLTVPANASVAFPVGTVITVMQLGVGQTTIAITTDTLLNPALTAKLRARYSVASLTKITATSWVLSGDLAAS